MKSEDGTGGRHALWVLKEMWECHPTCFIHNRQAGDFGYLPLLYDRHMKYKAVPVPKRNSCSLCLNQIINVLYGSDVHCLNCDTG